MEQEKYNTHKTLNYTRTNKTIKFVEIYICLFFAPFPLYRSLHTTRNIIHLNLCIAMLFAKLAYGMVFMAKADPVSKLCVCV